MKTSEKANMHNQLMISLLRNWEARDPTKLDMHTVLHSREGHLNVVRFLVNEAHCDPNVKDNDGWIPLHYACR